MTTPLWAILVYIAASAYGAVGQYFFKRGADKLKFKIRELITNWHLLIAVFIYVTATFIALIALKHGELSVLYPFVATNFIWVALIANRWLGEKINK